MDNAFVLSVKVRSLSDILQADADAHLFLDNVLDEISFTGGTAERLLDAVKQNDSIIDREELLYSFYDVENRLLNLLAGMEQGRFCFNLENNPEIAEKVHTAQDTARKQKAELDALLAENPESAGDPRVVSSAEMTQLLQGF
jgi:hypothetical protein